MENVFCSGAIPPAMVVDLLSTQTIDKGVGAHSLFLGQVRNDLIEDKRVLAIDFASYEEMAHAKTKAIADELKKKYEINYVRVLQSLGIIKTGEICLLVLTCAPHRKAAIDACNEMVERFKSEVPVWGKELFEDDSYKWKVNTI